MLLSMTSSRKPMSCISVHMHREGSNLEGCQLTGSSATVGPASTHGSEGCKSRRGPFLIQILRCLNFEEKNSNLGGEEETELSSWSREQQRHAANTSHFAGALRAVLPDVSPSANTTITLPMNNSGIERPCLGSLTPTVPLA